MKKIKGIGVAGFSLVELIISLAILAVVGTALGGAMYVSSRSYTRGAAEVKCQEEAQVASNLICDWIIDAKVVNLNDDEHWDESDHIVEGESAQLFILRPDENGNSIKIKIWQDGDELLYSAWNLTTSEDLAIEKTLATNVKGVKFYSTFKSDRNVKISIDFEVSERTYHSVTDTTSRSHDFISESGASTVGAPVIRFGLVSNNGGSHVTLEPGQKTSASQYTFEVFVDNCDPDTVTMDFPTCSAPNSTIVDFHRVSGTNKWECTVTTEDGASHDDIYIFKARNLGGSDTKPLTVRIRRVNDCSFVNYVTDPSTGNHTWSPTSGTAGSAGSIYDNIISLGATNWEEELDIVGTDSAVIGKNGFDAAPWNYVPVTDLTVQFMMWADGGHHWVNASDKISTYSITSGATPAIHVELAETISYPLAVIVSAPHSGSLVGNDAERNDPHCGYSVASYNKAFTIDGRTLSYGDNNEAYYDVIYIKPSIVTPFPAAGGNFNRGTPAFMITEFNDSFRSTLLSEITDKIKDDIISRNRSSYVGVAWGYSDASWQYHNLGHAMTEAEYQQYVVPNLVNTYISNNNPDSSRGNQRPLTYYTILEYRVKGTSTWSKYVVSECHGAFSDIRSDNHDLVKMDGAEASIFKLNQDYEVKVYMDVYYFGDLIYTSPVTTGSVPRAIPYVYNPGATTETNFESALYSYSNPYVYNQSTAETREATKYTFPVYFTGVCLNNESKIYFKVEYEDTPGHWTEVDFGTKIKVDGAYEGSFTSDGNTVDHVRLTDGTNYNVGAYNENIYGDNFVNVEKVFLSQSIEGANTGMYRIYFKTDYNECQTIYSGSSGGDCGSVSNPQDIEYTLTTPTGDISYIYFKIV